MSLAYTIVYFTAAAICALVAAKIGQHRMMKGGTTLTVLVATLSLWALFSGFAEIASTIEIKLVLAKIYFLFIALTPICLLVFALQISTYEHLVTRKFLSWLALVPILTLAAAWSNPLHHLFWTDVRWDLGTGEPAILFLHGPLYWIWTVAAYALLSIAIAIVIRSMWGTQQLFKNQSTVAVVAICAPIAGNLMYLTSFTPWPNLDTTSLGFVVSGLAVSWGRVRLHIFDIVPIARESVFKSMSDEVFVLDSFGRVVDCNPTALSFLRLPVSKIIGQHVNQLFSAQPELLRYALADKETNTEILLTSPQGDCYYDLRTTSIVDATGNTAGKLLTLRDINDYKQATQQYQEKLEQRVEERTRELRDAESKLRQSEKLEAVGQLAGGVAHDFNNLLTAILGYSDLLLEQIEQDHHWHNSLNQIKIAGNRASVLTKQLLAYSRKQILQPEVIDLGENIASLETMLRSLIGENITMDVQRAPDLYAVKADPVQMDQVIMNLVVNARDAMPRGGNILVKVENFELDSQTASKFENIAAGKFVRLSVSDTGTGIDKETLPRIFEPFFTTKDVSQGTGLGLSTVFGIVNQSGGEIEVDSVEGKGTTFRIYLPRSEDCNLIVEDSSPVAKDTISHETILLVEDEEIIRTLFQQALEDQGYHVLTANNGLEALSLAGEYQETIDLIITDVIMPKMGGYELMQEISKSRPDLAVLFISGYSDVMVSNQGLIDKDHHFLQKPFDISELEEKIRSILDAVNEGIDEK